MLYTALKTITPTITALNIFERFAPLVQTAERYDETTQTQDGRSIGSRVAYPVGWGITGAACWEGGRYQLLTPRSGNKAVGYFEALGGVSLIRSEGAKFDTWVYQVNARLVCWFNVAKMNVNETGLTDITIADKIGVLINEALHLKEFAITDSQFDNATVRPELISIAQKDKNVFSKYSYSGIEGLMFYPYDFVALDYRLTIKVNKNCLLALTFGEALDCHVILPE